MKPGTQFNAHIVLIFEEHQKSRKRVFGFDDSGIRRVPMSMDGVDGLNTVCLQIAGAAQFSEGQEFDADCRVIWVETFTKIVKQGVRFKLWDGGFFADGVVTERIEDGWHS